MSLGPSVNLWVGENGAGKTSVLEAVSILSAGRSFATSRIKSIIALDQPSLTVFGRIQGQHQEHRLAVQVNRDDERKLRLDGAVAKNQVALSRLLPVLQITPHSVDVITGSPGDRRRFMDWGAFHWSGGNGQSFNALRRALVQRNSLLRSGILNGSDLAPWEQQIGLHGEEIDRWRREFVADVRPVFDELLVEMELGIELELVYRNGWGDGDLTSTLEGQRARDIRARSTLSGPQRADFELVRDGAKAGDTLSRGQLKVSNLSLVLAQLQASTKRGIAPVLCLDDPGAELDHRFLGRVWEIVVGSGAQVLATGITVDRVGLSEGQARVAEVFHVKHGRIAAK
ncbi:MAG: DNA replication and repair protein RecF [Litoricolaceae bacterium]|nr:DNA replication and repair protein RecF [Litorivicinaceae bacterium]